MYSVLTVNNRIVFCKLFSVMPKELWEKNKLLKTYHVEVMMTTNTWQYSNYADPLKATDTPDTPASDDLCKKVVHVLEESHTQFATFDQLLSVTVTISTFNW